MGECRCGGVGNFVHRYPHMTFIIDALPVKDEQHLRRFVFYEECLRYLVRKGAEIQKVQVVKIDGFRLPHPFQPAFYQGAGGAAGAVFKNKLGSSGRFFYYLFQLCFCL